MCQIIAIKAKYKKMKKILNSYSADFSFLLEEKGGDYFSAALLGREGILRRFSLKNIPTSDILFEKLNDIFTGSYVFDDDSFVYLLLFSRQTPEMELNEVLNQPYELGGSYIAVHGTISNDKAIAKKYGRDIAADTEIFTFIEYNSEEPSGTYAAIKISPNKGIETFEHGLKLWKGFLTEDNKLLGEIVSTTDTSYLTEPLFNDQRYAFKNGPLFVAYSGGMDVALSTYLSIHLEAPTEVYLNYFDWGTVASTMEIQSVNKAAILFQEEFNIEVFVNIIDAKIYFGEYFKMNGAYAKIADPHAVGSENETEAPIAYVPYRNTQFAILLSSIAEEMGLKDVTFIFGLNLSEGMVFMDNSEGWLKSIESTIKYGGKDFSITGTYTVDAPYFARTKTNMIKDFIHDFGLKTFKKLINTTYSCYYPGKNGQPCGECGSCILRRKALTQVKGQK